MIEKKKVEEKQFTENKIDGSIPQQKLLKEKSNSQKSAKTPPQQLWFAS